MIQIISVGSQELTANTEIGMYAIWNSDELSFINCRKKWQETIAENKSVIDLMNKGIGVFWNTGGDGNQNITIRVNPSNELYAAEEDCVELKTFRKKFIVADGQTIVGSPEWAGMEQEGLKEGQLQIIENLTPGTYSVNVYFLFSEEQKENNGYIVTLKHVLKSQQFPPATEVPQLG